MSKRDKNKYVAAMLAYFFGGFGVHRFYLGDYGKGVLYLLFCWTFIPLIISFFEIFYFLFMSDDVFNRRYNGANALPTNAPRYALPAPNAYPATQMPLQSHDYSMGYTAGYSAAAYAPSSPVPAGADGSVAPLNTRSAVYNPSFSRETAPSQRGGGRSPQRDAIEQELSALNRRRLDGEISEEQYLVENQRLWRRLGR